MKFHHIIWSNTYLNRINHEYRCGPRFLSKNEFERVVIACYPRSGTTLLRRYIEEITKVVTGSDSDLRRKLVKELKDKGNQVVLLK